jgi:hypothetical protein
LIRKETGNQQTQVGQNQTLSLCFGLRGWFTNLFLWRSGTIWGPGDEEKSVISKSPQPLSQKQIDQLNSGEVLFFHFAEGEYEDYRGDTYLIDYCYMYNPLSPIVMRVCPEKYWPKKRTDRRGTPSLDQAPKVATGTIEPPPPSRRTTSETVAVESRVTPSIDIRVIRTAEQPKLRKRKTMEVRICVAAIDS